MLDIGFFELGIIGLACLLVVGPKRLPVLFKTFGVLLSKGQSYVSQVKSDVEKEINLSEFKDAENEIETLKQYIIDLKQRIAVYIPIKDDSTDKKLAEFINNYPERSKLKIMFMRVSEGVYQFGTKRVAVKVEKDNIKIRVGGGYLSIDEFLDQYTPVELEKLERKDPLKRFSEKVSKST